MPDAIDPYIFYDYRAWQEVATVEACLLFIWLDTREVELPVEPDESDEHSPEPDQR
jgi:hypothetical protein